jgi:hypothetical protein
VKANVDKVSAEVAVELVLMRQNLNSLWIFELGVHIAGRCASLRNEHHKLRTIIVRQIVNLQKTRRRHIFARHPKLDVALND